MNERIIEADFPQCYKKPLACFCRQLGRKLLNSTMAWAYDWRHSSRIRFLRFLKIQKKRDFLRFLKCHVK